MYMLLHAYLCALIIAYFSACIFMWILKCIFVWIFACMQFHVYFRVHFCMDLQKYIKNTHEIARKNTCKNACNHQCKQSCTQICIHTSACTLVWIVVYMNQAIVLYQNFLWLKSKVCVLLPSYLQLNQLESDREKLGLIISIFCTVPISPNSKKTCSYTWTT